MYDVLIAGAGPAGNMAALRLSEMGHRVAVVDWRTNVGDKLCTGIIGKECAEKYPPSPSDVRHHARAADVVSPLGTRYTVARSDVQAYVVDRVSYVKSFADQAIRAGAKYILGPRISAIDISDDCVSVTANDGSESERLKAEVLVLASGFGSPLLNMAGIKNGRRDDFMIGCQTVVRTRDLDHTEVYLGDHVAKGSFGWLVPLSESRGLVGAVSRENPAGNMGGFIDSLKRDGRVDAVESEPANWGIPLRPIRRTYANRVVVAGDAAGLVKPLTGGGIYYSLTSGELAAEAIDAALKIGDFSARQLKGYEQSWKSVFGKELRIGYYGRVIFESLSAAHIERLLSEFLSEDILDDLVNSDDFSFDWHGKMILKALKYQNLTTLLRSFGPLVTSVLPRLR